MTPREKFVLKWAEKVTAHIDTCSVSIVSHQWDDEARFLSVNYTENSYSAKHISVDTAYELLDIDNDFNRSFFKDVVLTLYEATYKG